MKKLLIITIICCLAALVHGQKKCDVKRFYKAIEAERDVKVLTAGGDVEEAAYILVPTKLDEDKYQVSVTKESANFYKIAGQDIFIETRYCYEYATSDDVILIVNSHYSYDKGEIIFLD